MTGGAQGQMSVLADLLQMRIELGLAIRGARERRGWDQPELAKRCFSKSDVTVRRWERGQNLPPRGPKRTTLIRVLGLKGFDWKRLEELEARERVLRNVRISRRGKRKGPKRPPGSSGADAVKVDKEALEDEHDALPPVLPHQQGRRKKRGE